MTSLPDSRKAAMAGFLFIEKKKFKTRHLKNLIRSIRNYSISQQHQILSETLDEWMADYEQVDDILIIGRNF